MWKSLEKCFDISSVKPHCQTHSDIILEWSWWILGGSFSVNHLIPPIISERSWEIHTHRGYVIAPFIDVATFRYVFRRNEWIDRNKSEQSHPFFLLFFSFLFFLLFLPFSRPFSPFSFPARPRHYDRPHHFLNLELAFPFSKISAFFHASLDAYTVKKSASVQF